MSSSTGRYATATVMVTKLPDGRTVRWLLPRILPLPRDMDIESTIQVRGGRLDLAAARVYGDPLQYHRLCDANDAMNPFHLAAETGGVLRVPIATPGD